MSFYSNDLAATTLEPIMNGESVEVIACMHGLGKLARRWMGSETLHHKEFLVTSLTVACNKFMNGMDHMDQCHCLNVM